MESLMVVAGVSLVALLAIFFSIKSLIIICKPSEVVIFSGPQRRSDQTVGYRALRGGRGLRIPLLERVDRLDLTNISVDVGVTAAYTRDGVPINVQGVANLKLDGNPPGLDHAVERLLGKPRKEIIRIARETLEGNLRGVLATLTPEQVNEDKERFANELVQEAEPDLRQLGLELDTLKIQTVSDDSGYLSSIGRVQTAQVIRRARIAEAQRTSEATVQKAINFQAMRLSQIEAEVGVANAEANKRIRDAETRAPAEVASEQAEVQALIARAEAELRVQTARIEQVKLQLDADVVAPARAYKARRIAEAQAEVATIREEGKAVAKGLEDLAKIWIAAGDDAKEIFLMDRLRTLVGIMVGTVDKVSVDQITVVGDGASTAGQAASLFSQLKSAADVDVPALSRALTIGAKSITNKSDA